jgi:hypothetical protein
VLRHVTSSAERLSLVSAGAHAQPRSGGRDRDCTAVGQHSSLAMGLSLVSAFAMQRFKEMFPCDQHVTDGSHGPA